MSPADRWCIGVPPQPPHVPSDRALIEVTAPRSFRLCRRCWVAYVSQANDRQEDPTDG